MVRSGASASMLPSSRNELVGGRDDRVECARAQRDVSAEVMGDVAKFDLLAADPDLGLFESVEIPAGDRGWDPGKLDHGEVRVGALVGGEP
jgi:hypothetical protein